MPRAPPGPPRTATVDESRARLVDRGGDLLGRFGRERGDETVARLAVRDRHLSECLAALELGPQIRLGDADVGGRGGEDVLRAEWCCLDAKMATPPGSCAMTASAATGESAAAATPPVSRSATPLAMSVLSMYFISSSFPAVLADTQNNIRDARLHETALRRARPRSVFLLASYCALIHFGSCTSSSSRTIPRVRGAVERALRGAGHKDRDRRRRREGARGRDGQPLRRDRPGPRPARPRRPRGLPAPARLRRAGAGPHAHRPRGGHASGWKGSTPGPTTTS